MLRCLHLADLHLGWSASWLGDQGAAYASQRDRVLKDITSWLLNHKREIDLVLIVGDLFENHRPDTALVESVMAELRAWVNAGLTVITVPGNHDEITYRDSVFQLYGDRWPGILITNPMPEPPLELTVRGEQLYLYSLAYTGGLTKIDDYLKPYPRVPAAGIHLAAFHGSLDWQTDERGLPLSSRLLAEAGYDYVALGHFHKPQQQKIGNTTIAYAGAIASKGFNDIGSGKLTVVSLQAGAAAVEYIPWQDVDHEIVQLDANQFADEAELVESILSFADPQLLLRVELQGAANFICDSSALEARLARNFYHLQIIDTTLHFDQGLLALWARETTIRGHFVRRMQERLAATEDASERQLIELALRRGMEAFLEGGR